MALKITDALLDAQRYLRKHPTTVVSMARHALRREIAIPLDAIRWALEETLTGATAPDELEVISRDPAFGVRAVIAVMGNTIRASASIRVADIRIDADRVVLVLRFSQVQAKADDPKSNVGKLLASGALNLDKPADLLKFAPKKPAIIVGGKGDTLELDLLQVPSLARNKVFRRALATLSPVVEVRDIRTNADWLVVEVMPHPSGIRAAARGAFS